MLMRSVDKRLLEFRQAYADSGKPIRISFRELCKPWEWARRSDVYTHFLHKYPAKILPYIPIYFLSSEEYASKNEAVLDPFCGTGTVLLESIVHPYFARKAIGVEINPLARLIAKVKTTPLNVSELKAASENLCERIEHFPTDVQLPEFENRDLWFSKRVQKRLGTIRSCIEDVDNSDHKDFFLASFSSIIRDVSFADPKIAPPVILRSRNFIKNPKLMLKVEKVIQKKKRANPLQYFKQAVAKNLDRIETLNSALSLSGKRTKSEIVWDDARNIRRAKMKCNGELDKTKTKPIRDGSIGLVITSPPYINAQNYVRTTKFELFWLGMTGQGELKHLNERLIGTEAVYHEQYKDLRLIGVASADKVIKKIFKLDPRRAFIVSKYFSDMQRTIEEIYRVLKRNGRFILVVGNNLVKGIKVRNHEILSDIATQGGLFRKEIVLVDQIKSRGMITKRHETGGLVLDEWVVVLRKKG